MEFGVPLDGKAPTCNGATNGIEFFSNGDEGSLGKSGMLSGDKEDWKG